MEIGKQQDKCWPQHYFESASESGRIMYFKIESLVSSFLSEQFLDSDNLHINLILLQCTGNSNES